MIDSDRASPAEADCAKAANRRPLFGSWPKEKAGSVATAGPVVLDGERTI
jgi:hypothetical protein